MNEEDVQYGVTDDYFDAVMVSDGVAVRMSDNVAAILATMTYRLLQLLEGGVVEDGGRFRRGRAAEAILRDMFPDVYRDRAQSRSFRERHAGMLRDSAPVRRVHARVVAGATHVIDHAEVDDWIITLGLGQFLYTRRSALRPGEIGLWTSHMQAALAAAVNPRLSEL